MNPKPAGRNDGHVTDYSKVTEYIYIGSNLCEASACPIHGPDFKKLNVCVEINLDNERKEIPPDDMESYTWMPVVDGYSPSQVQLDSGTALIHEAVRAKRVAYVHCRNGHGRSPTLVAAYFIRHKGMNVNSAEKLIKSKRPEIHIEDRQIEALRKFEKIHND